MNEYIEHTNLKSRATGDDISRLWGNAIKYKFKGICVNPVWVPVVYNVLKDSDLKIITVVGYPLGANETKTKLVEAELALEHGVHELDVVWNLGAFKQEKYYYTLKELIDIVNLAKDKVVKVIVETCYLNDAEILDAYRLVHDSGAKYIKTSTGFGSVGARVKDIIAWKQLDGLKIKASGGIVDLRDACSLIDAGADVLGTSNGVQIMEQYNASKDVPE